jgi:large subunit ribosomal protein L18e
MPYPTGPTNPTLRRLIRELREVGKKKKAQIWLDVAERLSRPRRMRVEVNLSRLNLYSNPGSIIVVPGKVLGAGKLDHQISVAAFKFSSTAQRKIIEAKGRAITIKQLLEENPAGKNVLIMG